MYLYDYEQVLAARSLDPEERKIYLMHSSFQVTDDRGIVSGGWGVLGGSGAVSLAHDTKESAEAEILWPLLVKNDLLSGYCDLSDGYYV